MGIWFLANLVEDVLKIRLLLNLGNTCTPTTAYSDMKAWMQEPVKVMTFYILGNCYKWNFEAGKVKKTMDWEYVPTDPGNLYMSQSIIREHFLSQIPIYLSCEEPTGEYSWYIVAGETAKVD